MRKKLITSMGEFLQKEFMDPLNLSANLVAKKINVPVSRIQHILQNRQNVDADTSIRLGRLFGMSDRFFLDVQIDINARNINQQNMNEYNKIGSIVKPPKFN
ncbi:HigA family addiction module antitoxin [Limosilactobacillus sp.]|uniref:HigA family addiction module antitoxin n=1 Tax=Limosilactobacillus sp. TaxID=2773925 RepID=UPI00345ED01C